MSWKKTASAAAAFSLAFFLNIAGYPSEEPSGKVIIFHAGSLSVPFEEMEKNFEKAHPGIDIEREAAGSQACARKITDLHKPCDIMASADYRVINSFLIPAYASWNALFATNEMVLAYTDLSQGAAEINRDNWFETLSREGVSWGHSDPNLDPCGYRALMVIQLAETYYKKPGLYRKVLANRPESNIRPKSVELISLLQTGNLDYAWEYRSVAVQHGLKYLELPPEINLGDPAFDEYYGQALVKVTGKEPGEFIEYRGVSITYGVSLLNNASNREAATLFLGYLLSPDGGLKVMAGQGQKPLSPPVVTAPDPRKLMPESLQPLVVSAKAGQKN